MNIISVLIITAKRDIGKVVCLISVLLSGALLPVPFIYAGTVVERVLDGDTVALTDGTRVRLVGLDAPEMGEPLAGEAREMLADMILGREVTVDACAVNDVYGRTLAVVTVGGSCTNLEMLREGLALPMLIPPCGNAVAREVLFAASQALDERKGLYVREEFHIVSADSASVLLGKRGVVKGRVLDVYRGDKATFINFGEDWKSDFTAVLFDAARVRFRALGLDPEDLEGRVVMVAGKVREYNGPEIIVEIPEQILPMDADAYGPWNLSENLPAY